MKHLWSLLCLIAAGVTSAQPHHGGATLGSLPCPECGGHAHPFPACLTHAAHTCHTDEVCMVRYGGGHETTIHCHKANQCQEEVGGAARQCSTGGAEVHGQCQICCTDTTCITHTLPLINSSTTTNVMALHCPTTCHGDQTATCLGTGNLCHENQFCHLDKDTSLSTITGKCAEKREIAKCQQEMTSTPCNGLHNKCTMGCCENEDCVAAILNNGSAPTSLWQLVMGGCVDVLENGQCAALDTSQHLCGDRLSVRLCPKTCGLCTLFNASLCRDTVHTTTGCPGLVTTSNICNTSLALSICPVTCHMCDQVLDHLLQTALHGLGTTTPTVAQTLPPLTVTDAPAVNPTLASVATLPVPAETQPITDAPVATQPITDAPVATQPITDAPVATQPITDAPVATQPITDAPVATQPITDAPVATQPITDAPVATRRVTDAPSVSQPVTQIPLATQPVTHDPVMTSSHAIHASTSPVSLLYALCPAHHGHSADTTLPTDQSDTCRDSIQQMSCADITDVCTSPLLVSHCHKFCGLCSSNSTTVSG